jgi:hypothetical protein
MERSYSPTRWGRLSAQAQEKDEEPLQSIRCTPRVRGRLWGAFALELLRRRYSNCACTRSPAHPPLTTVVATRISSTTWHKKPNPCSTTGAAGCKWSRPVAARSSPSRWPTRPAEGMQPPKREFLICNISSPYNLLVQRYRHQRATHVGAGPRRDQWRRFCRSPAGTSMARSTIARPRGATCDEGCTPHARPMLLITVFSSKPLANRLPGWQTGGLAARAEGRRHS